MDKHSRLITYSIATILLFVSIVFSIFIVANWKYIYNPLLIPNYTEGIGIFGYGKDDLAKYRIWAFELPMQILPYLVFVEVILTINLVLKNTLRLTGLIIFLLSALILTSVIVKILPDLSDNAFFMIRYYLNGYLQMFVYFVSFILFLVSIILLFIKKFRSHRLFLIMNILTVILLYVFLIAYMLLFFD